MTLYALGEVTGGWCLPRFLRGLPLVKGPIKRRKTSLSPSDLKKVCAVATMWGSCLRSSKHLPSSGAEPSVACPHWTEIRVG